MFCESVSLPVSGWVGAQAQTNSSLGKQAGWFLSLLYSTVSYGFLPGWVDTREKEAVQARMVEVVFLSLGLLVPHRAAPWELNPRVYVNPCVMGLSSCLAVSGTQGWGTQLLPHASCHSCRQGLTLTFVGPEIEVTASMRAP